MILATSDFEEGYTSIDQGGFSDFETYLSETKENNFIKQILGNDLGQEFIDDLTGTPSRPQTAKFTTIFNELNFEYGSSSFYTTGLFEILKYLFYFDYVSQQEVINQAGGNKGVSLEAGVNEGLIRRSTIIYNRAVQNIEILQGYVRDNSATYSDFNGECFDYLSPL